MAPNTYVTYVKFKGTPNKEYKYRSRSIYQTGDKVVVNSPSEGLVIVEVVRTALPLDTELSMYKWIEGRVVKDDDYPNIGGIAIGIDDTTANLMDNALNEALSDLQRELEARHFKADRPYCVLANKAQNMNPQPRMWFAIREQAEAHAKDIAQKAFAKQPLNKPVELLIVKAVSTISMDPTPPIVTRSV